MYIPVHFLASSFPDEKLVIQKCTRKYIFEYFRPWTIEKHMPFLKWKQSSTRGEALLGLNRKDKKIEAERAVMSNLYIRVQV